MGCREDKGAHLESVGKSMIIWDVRLVEVSTRGSGSLRLWPIRGQGGISWNCPNPELVRAELINLMKGLSPYHSSG